MRRGIPASVAAAVVVVTAGLLTVAIGDGGSADAEELVAAYAADVPFDLAVPTWLPAGYSLADGDGPWTRIDLDRDGRLESTRAELHYAASPQEHPPSLMIAQQTQHPLPTSLRARQAVPLSDGTTAYLSAEDPWWALWWQREDGVTTSIVARGLTIDDLVRVASSMTIVE